MYNEKTKVKVIRPFMFNGTMLSVGAEVEMNCQRAVNHMRVGDLERDETLISIIKKQRAEAADAARADALADW